MNIHEVFWLNFMVLVVIAIVDLYLIDDAIEVHMKASTTFGRIFGIYVFLSILSLFAYFGYALHYVMKYILT